MQRRLAVQINQPVNLRPFKSQSEMLGSLEDLKREFHVHDARNAGEIAFANGVESLTLVEVLLLFRGGPRLVGNFTAFDDAFARGHCITCRVIEEIVSSAAADLPNSLKIRFSFRS